MIEGSRGLTRAQKTFTPIMEGVVIQPIPQDQTAGGLALPDRSRSDATYRTPRGWVIAVGKDVKEIQVGDMVLLGNAPMHLVNYDGTELIVTTESHIVGIVDGKNPTRVKSEA